MVTVQFKNEELTIVSRALYYYVIYLDKLDADDLHDYMSKVMDLGIKLNDLLILSLQDEIKKIN